MRVRWVPFSRFSPPKGQKILGTSNHRAVPCQIVFPFQSSQTSLAIASVLGAGIANICDLVTRRSLKRARVNHLFWSNVWKHIARGCMTVFSKWYLLGGQVKLHARASIKHARAGIHQAHVQRQCPFPKALSMTFAQNHYFQEKLLFSERWQFRTGTMTTWICQDFLSGVVISCLPSLQLQLHETVCPQQDVFFVPQNNQVYFLGPSELHLVLRCHHQFLGRSAECGGA